MKINKLWGNFPYILLFAYIIFLVFSMYNMKRDFNLIINHPVQVLQYSRDIKTRLGELQNSLPGLMSTSNLSYDELIDILERQEEMQDESAKEIDKLFLGDKEYLANLWTAFTKIRELRREAARQLTGNTDYSKAEEVYQRLIAPQVSVVNTNLDAIITYAKNTLEIRQFQAARYFVINVLLVAGVGLFISIAFFLSRRREQIKTRQIEDQYKLFNQLSENIDEIFIIAEKANTFEYVTTNSERLISVQSADLMADPKKLYGFLPEEDAKWLKDTLASADGDKERTVVMDNGNRVFKLTVQAIHSGIGGKFIVSIQDRTKDFQQKQALSDALESANAASVAKSSFLSHMSHEIRTPMNAIIGMTTIALSKISNTERVQDCLCKIAESSKHLLGLINDVLDMSKIENGKLSINHEPFSLPSSIRSLNELVRPQAESRQLNFEIFQENVDVEELTGDPLRLNQILLNILSNALKFTPPGGTISLTIKQLMKSHNNTRLAFVISDTGIGMSQEFLNRLYHPFEQATSSTTAKYGGTGLGMSITFNLITLMGGTINVTSEEGKGTTFTVELPFGCRENTLPRTDGLPNLKVLVVDDDYGTCEHASLLLEKMGLTTHWCTSGKKAVEMVREAQSAGADFDVCFIDWKMPEMDGAETARKIREVSGDMLIIIISAYDWSPIERVAKEAGVNDFVAKPFFASTIYNVLLNTTQRQAITAQTPEQPEKNEAYDFSGKRILLVEDNEFNREIGQEYLAMVNATVEDAEDGQQAVDKVLNSPPGYYDLILMDVQMPILGGYEATRIIRASGHPDAKSIPILAMTANAFNEDVSNAVASGMNGHIAKPIDVDKLYRLLKSHLGQ